MLAKDHLFFSLVTDPKERSLPILSNCLCAMGKDAMGDVIDAVAMIDDSDEDADLNAGVCPRDFYLIYTTNEEFSA